MTNAERLLAAIDAAPASRLAEEIDYLTEAWADDPEAEGMTRADAFWDVATAARHNGDKSLARACDDAMIVAGFLRARVSGEEVVISGRDRAPARGGVRFDADLSWQAWIAR